MFYGNLFEYGMESGSGAESVFGEGLQEMLEVNSRLRRADK
jgi:hypothetical protein